MSMPRARRVHPEPCVRPSNGKGPLAVRGRSSNRPGPSSLLSLPMLPTFVLLHSRGNRVCTDHYAPPYYAFCVFSRREELQSMRIGPDSSFYRLANFVWRLMKSWITLVRLVSERILRWRGFGEDLIDRE